MDCVSDLAEAEADLVIARRELEDAERHVERAMARVESVIKEEQRCRPFEIGVLYNGVQKPFTVRREEVVKTLLDQALKAFGPIQNAHTLALFRGGQELSDTLTIEAAGVTPHEVLLLRPSTVKGG